MPYRERQNKVSGAQVSYSCKFFLDLQITICKFFLRDHYIMIQSDV